VIDGISIALPTYNHLEYVKKCVYSIQKYSALPKTEVSIFVDGSTDGTIEWLEQEGIPYHAQVENKGAWSSWNQAVKHAKNEYVIQGEDDVFYGPDWDVNVARWIEELGDKYIVVPQIIEPVKGSYPIVPCGTTVDKFDEEKFVAYCHKNMRHEIIPDYMGLWIMKKEMFWGAGGFDPIYDPVFFGALDFYMRFIRKYPDVRFVRVWDSMTYHFPPMFHRGHRGVKKYQDIAKAHLKIFMDRWGMEPGEAYRQIPAGLE